MATYEVEVVAYVRITVNNPSVIDRCVNDEDGWRTRMYYNLADRDAVLRHLAYNAVMNGVLYANRLDGWADLTREDCEMDVYEVDTEGRVEEVAAQQ